MKIIPLLSAFVFLLPCAQSVSAASKAVTPEWCDEQWKIETSAIYIDQAKESDIVRRWKKYGNVCAGTVTFESRLALAYASTQQFKQAREVLAKVDADRSKYRYLADFSKIVVDYLSVYASEQVAEADLLRLEAKFKHYVSQYPDFPDAYAFLGGLQTLLDNHESAITSLERGKNTSMDASGIYRNLTISYTAVGRYQDAVGAADTAYNLRNDVTSDRYFAYALAKANAGVGNLKSAETVLKLLAYKLPEVRKDPDFREAVEFVMKKQGELK